MFSKITNFIRDNYLMIIFILGFAGTFGSLYLSEIVKLPPCDLCWYQRILLYPIFILAAAALSFKEKISPKIILTFSVLGMLLSGYHYLLQKFGFARNLVNCSLDNPCTQVDWEILGFITIPLLSFAAFTLITIISVIAIKKKLVVVE